MIYTDFFPTEGLHVHWWLSEIFSDWLTTYYVNFAFITLMLQFILYPYGMAYIAPICHIFYIIASDFPLPYYLLVQLVNSLLFFKILFKYFLFYKAFYIAIKK